MGHSATARSNSFAFGSHSDRTTLEAALFAMRICTLGIIVVALIGCAEEAPVAKSPISSPQPQQTTAAQIAPEQPKEPEDEKNSGTQTDVAATAKELPVVAAKEAHFEKLKSENLPNLIRVCDKVTSGGVPEGDEAFAELKALGIKTIISVDGAKPDLELARKYGLKYVHLPHGYDGIPDARVKELGKAVHDLEGPIYIHCHHGKHRSPAATSAACVAAGLVPRGQALEILKLAGTSPNYKGLYQSAEHAKPMSEEELRALQVEFQESVEIPPMAEAMVVLEHTFDLVKKLAENKWKPLARKPEVDAAHEVLLLQEHFTEMLRLDETKKQPKDFAEMLQDSETAALALQAGVDKLSQEDHDETYEQLGQSVQRIEANCKKCHEQYRNTPLGEK